MKRLLKSNRGFTLVELMIVITVIAILTTIAVVSFTRVQKQSRDTKRKGDLRSIATATQAYFSEASSYPTDLSTALVPTYIPTFPIDPTGDAMGSYSYSVDTSQNVYTLCAQLEAVSGGAKSYWNVTTRNTGGFLTNSCVSAQ